MTSLLPSSLTDKPSQLFLCTQPESLDALFALVINDDYRAFEKIFKRTYKSLCTLSRGMVKKHELSEEIVDDVFYSLWKNRKKIQITTSFHAYLQAAVRNKSFDWLRKLKHEKSTLLEHAATVACEQSIAHETLIYEELHEQLEAAIQGLPKQCRVIFLMSRDQDLKYKEIAEILNISIKTVDTQVGRALRYLRKTIDRRGF
jgi:RNA polymerase sigma-70 factor (family 1)